VLFYPIRDLDCDTALHMLQVLADNGITCITMGRLGKREGDDRAESYDGVLELLPDGGWTWQEVGTNATDA
jgi:hypothetical protein